MPRGKSNPAQREAQKEKRRAKRRAPYVDPASCTEKSVAVQTRQVILTGECTTDRRFGKPRLPGIFDNRLVESHLQSSDTSSPVAVSPTINESADSTPPVEDDPDILQITGSEFEFE